MAVTFISSSTSKAKKLPVPKDHDSQGDPPSKMKPAKSPAKIVQEVLPPKKKQSAAPAIENLPSEQAALAKMDELLLDQAVNYALLGGVLQVMKEKGWCAGEKNFRDLCERHFGFRVRKAEYLIRNYNFLIEANLAWDEVRKVGWTKLRELCGKVEPEALSGWLDDAKAMTVLQLREALKADQDSDAPGTTVAKVSTMTFKPHPDQVETIKEGLEKAKIETGTEYDTVALEHMALSYLSGPKAAKAPSPDASAAQLGTAFVELFQQLGIIGALDLVAKADPGSNPEAMVVAFLKETGVEDASRLLDLAFPEDPDPASEAEAA